MTEPPVFLLPAFEAIVEESVQRFKHKYPFVALNRDWVSDYEAEIRRVVSMTINKETGREQTET